MAEEYGLSPLEVLPGKIPRTEIEQMLPAADIAVSTLVDNPALEINSLNKVFDALAAARPVVFNHAGWLPEVLAANSAGWRLSRNPTVAADQLLDGMRSGEISIPAGSQAALDLAQREFDRDLLFDRFLRVVENAVHYPNTSNTTTPSQVG